MYQLIIVVTKNSINGACIHSQTVGLYESKAEAEEAANGLECTSKEFTVSTIILRAPKYTNTSRNENLNY